MKCLIVDIKGKEKGSVDLPEDVFGGRVNTDVIHQAVVKYHVSKRQGTVKTKKRSEVSGGGKKPFRQKGTGRARQGSIRSPLWVKGGIVFGPQPRDFNFPIPKKVKKIALRESLKAKIADKEIVCIEDIKEPLKKTKEFALIMDNLKLNGKVLGVLDGCDESVSRVSRNIAFLSLIDAKDVNAYDVLRNKFVLLSRTSLNTLIERVKI
ncbi:MAG: 50S ribosomal protein L4 [Candidatus Omnitrophica bacterium]|nr:50S ribosomal protein L4 [Candidatus Omnitrophota bacterium]